MRRRRRKAGDEPRYAGDRAACVGTSGEIIEVGHAILNRGCAVRPAIGSISIHRV